MENLLDNLGYARKWHGSVQAHRYRTKYSVNEFIILSILERINIDKGLCVEFGAWDGVKNSNTRLLIESKEWSSIQIEPERDRFLSLEWMYRDNKEVKCINSFVDTGDNLFDDIVDGCPQIDFCSIDIDGLDLDVFETFTRNLPTVICIEGGQALSPFNERVSTEIAKNNIHQSVNCYNQSFEEKGYKLLCCYQDCFFIKEEYYHLFDVSDNLFNLYLDGILALPRLPYLKKQLYDEKLRNHLIDFIISECSQINPAANLIEKSNWVDLNYDNIKKQVKKLRNLYA